MPDNKEQNRELSHVENACDCHGDLCLPIDGTSITEPICIRDSLSTLFEGGSLAGGSHARNLSFAASAMTLRECQVLLLALCGYDAQTSAELLGIGERTVESHRSSLIRRFAVSNMSELFRVISIHSISQLALRSPVK